jgi:hypothetical protein
VLFWLAPLAPGNAPRSCAAPEPIAVEYRRSAAVFIGRVTALEIVNTPPPRPDVHTVATFEVERGWKGSRKRTAKVRTCGGGQAICTVGFTFAHGVRYVVFATGTPLETTICQRTSTVEHAGDVLRWLRDPSNTKRSPRRGR